MLQLPPEGSHPVLFARRLLLLATLLQGIPDGSVRDLACMTQNYRTVMSRLVTTATRLVMSNDELVSSLEGIECVMMESMFLNNAGNLRPAWLVNRRAMLLAQMLGLHFEQTSPSMMLEAETRNRIDPDHMWFRIVCSDRYLSLMLGLPQGSPDNNFALPHVLERCTALERLERTMAVAGGIVLQRNNTEMHDIESTWNVDRMLQEAAALMPLQWWLATPNFAILTDHKFTQETFDETLGLMNRFA